jgi:hypothetical protein
MIMEMMEDEHRKPKVKKIKRDWKEQGLWYEQPEPKEEGDLEWKI